ALALGMWGRFDSVPFEFMGEPEAVGEPQWDHMAVSRLTPAWGGLDVVTRSSVTAAIDG
ncbi:MAG: hypothetical protein GWN73_41945, partial [Actinobacteria bacterium]|nr:hypothetical protein [Actinomycetota bacterium]NIU71584.1 hypothetical protein [Actinomycetota bacterium]NIW33539.1 hypothetical protein [Actinomycetota bacterium]